MIGNITLFQDEAKEDALKDGFVIANKSVNLTAVISDPSHFFQNASIEYSWYIDDKTFSKANNVLPYNFTEVKEYNVFVILMANVTMPGKNLTKVGKFVLPVKARNDIKVVNVTGNTWVKHDSLLHLDVNCTGGSGPFWYCYDFSYNKTSNFTCSDGELIFKKNCSFSLQYYFPKTGKYFVEIGILNDVDYKHKTIQVNVFTDCKFYKIQFFLRFLKTFENDYLNFIPF